MHNSILKLQKILMNTISTVIQHRFHTCNEAGYMQAFTTKHDTQKVSVTLSNFHVGTFCIFKNEMLEHFSLNNLQ